MGIAVVSDEISQRLDMKTREIDFKVDNAEFRIPLVVQVSSLKLYDYGDTFYGRVVAIGTSLCVVVIRAVNLL